MDPSLERWNKKYQEPAPYPEPNPRLLQNRSLLPLGGTALDLACGLGADALYLAKCDFSVTAWDGSEIALQLMQEEADRRSLTVHAICAPIKAGALEGYRFDLIYVHRFLDRALFPDLIQALNPLGCLYYETFTTETFESSQQSQGPKNPRFRLQANELLDLCKPLRTRLFIDGLTANPEGGYIRASKSLLIAEKGLT
jgi:tellurite methyltransferase